MGGIFSSPKPPQVIVPPAPPAADTTAEIKKKDELRKLSLARYLSGSYSTGVDVLRGSSGSSTRTGLNY